MNLPAGMKDACAYSLNDVPLIACLVLGMFGDDKKWYNHEHCSFKFACGTRQYLPL